MKSCITCSMPFEGNHANDIGLETSEGPICVHDVEEGKMKGPTEIFEGGVQWYMGAVTNGVRDLAERLCRKNMNSLPYWQQHPDPVLEGPQATEVEHAAAMANIK